MHTYAIARNPRTSLYEVHLDGCRHLATGRVEPMTEIQASSAKAAAHTYEAGNEGCLTKTSPCAR